MLNCAGTRRRAKWLWETSLDLIFPRTCIQCGRFINSEVGRFSCEDCRRSIFWITDPICDCCGAPFPGMVEPGSICASCRDNPPDFNRARSAFLYQSMGARLVHVLKYEGGSWLGSEIAKLLSQREDLMTVFRDSILVPVPLHPRKQSARGYNQSIVIARSIQSIIPEVRIENVLRRTRMTTSQTFLSRKQRLGNMRGAFECENRASRFGKTILIDDVQTTGATLNASALALKQQYVQDISAFTLAHG